MNKEKIEEIKEYIESSEVEVGEIDLGDKEICDIKANPVLLAEFYIKYFNEFNRVFRDCGIKEVKEIICYRKIFNELMKLSSYKNSDSEFGKSYSISLLEDYVLENYDLISGFFDFWLEVTG